MTRIHLIGIGGSGMSGIARLLMERGYEVTGSDLNPSTLAQELAADGALVSKGHRPEYVEGADLVVRSSAIPDENVEVQAALKMNIKVLKRADYLSQLMADRMGIAVAGTHGKTTTSAMIAWALTALNQDPSFLVGGVLNNLGTNARSGHGSTFVIEADEYDKMFLGLKPAIAVITSVEHDHPDIYPTPETFHQAFGEFVTRIMPEGKLVVCTDEPGARRLAEEASESGRTPLTYGLQGTPTYQAKNLRLNNRSGYVFDFVSGDRLFAKVALKVPGVHNVQNATAALAVIDLLDLSVAEAAQAMIDFRGTGRRFQIQGEAGGVLVIDDYAHHPTEIRATLQAAKIHFPDRGLWAVWQPHTFGRTRTFFDEFVEAFSDADHVLVTEVFSAREKIPNGFSARQLVSAMSHPDVVYVSDLDRAVEYLLTHVTQNEVVLVLSAGDATEISPRLIAGLRNRDHKNPADYQDPSLENTPNWHHGGQTHVETESEV